jgi:hypothetical protein
MTTPGVGPVVALTYRATVDVPADDDQQTAMQDDDLFAERPPDNEQRFNQNGWRTPAVPRGFAPRAPASCTTRFDKGLRPTAGN